MKPSKEALEQRIKELESDALKASQECCRSAKAEMKEVIAGLVIKIDEMNQTVKELEAENQRLKEQLAHFKDCYAELASSYDKAQLERKPLNAFACPRCGMVGQGEHVCEATPRPA